MKEGVGRVDVYELLERVRDRLGVVSLEGWWRGGLGGGEVVVGGVVGYWLGMEEGVRVGRVVGDGELEGKVYVGGLCKGEVGWRIGKEGGVGNE